MRKNAKKFEVFSNDYLGSVRTMYDPKKKQVYFHAVDVATCLGLKSPRASISAHTAPSDRLILHRKKMPQEVRDLFWTTTRGCGTVTMITKGALYKLIMVSRTDVAERFKDWVCNTVLVSIEQNGGYIFGQEELPEEEAKLIHEKTQILADEVAAKAEELMKAYDSIAALQQNLDCATENADYWHCMFNDLMDRYEELELQHSEMAKTSLNMERTDSNYIVLPNGVVVDTSEYESDKEE